MESIYPRRVPIMGNLTGNGWTVASQESVLSLIVVLGSSVSLVGLIFAFITYSLFSDLRTMSGTALMYMLANMFLTQLFYVVGVGGVQEDNLCFCLAFGIHYLRLAVISWLCVMTYDMLITFRNNVNINPRPEPVNVLISRFIKYSLFAWGVPSLSVISASIMRATMNHQTVDNLNPYNCWTLLEEVNAVYVIRCPDDRLKDHCNAHIPYAYKFDRVVDWNNDRGLYYGFYEQFRPDEWLHTYPELESMTSIRGVGFGLENVRADLDYYVRPASDGCWATRYPDSYFAAVEQAQDAVGQIALRIMRRNWTVCKDYRRSVARDETAAWAAYERDCTAVGPHVATILWQSQLGRVDPNVGKLSRLAGSGPFTADEQFDAAVRLVDATLGALTTVFDPPDAAIAAAGLAVVDGDYDSFFRQFHRAVKDYADRLPAVAKGVGFSREVLETFRAVVA